MSDNETEILLGNKQLVGIFFLFAILLGVAFTGGYMVGRGGGAKKTVAAVTPEASSESASTAASTPGQTHTVSADDGAAMSAPRPEETPEKPALGARKPRVSSAETSVAKAASAIPGSESEHADGTDTYTPRAGTRYLQVAATNRDEAEALADVLHKKGFHAHAAPKPGSAKFYRVIVGPVHDAGDLSSTRDALRKTGFREVIVQNY